MGKKNPYIFCVKNVEQDNQEITGQDNQETTGSVLKYVSVLQPRVSDKNVNTGIQPDKLDSFDMRTGPVRQLVMTIDSFFSYIYWSYDIIRAL